MGQAKRNRRLALPGQVDLGGLRIGIQRAVERQPQPARLAMRRDAGRPGRHLGIAIGTHQTDRQHAPRGTHPKREIRETDAGMRQALRQGPAGLQRQHGDLRQRQHLLPPVGAGLVHVGLEPGEMRQPLLQRGPQPGQLARLAGDAALGPGKFRGEPPHQMRRRIALDVEPQGLEAAPPRRGASGLDPVDQRPTGGRAADGGDDQREDRIEGHLDPVAAEGQGLVDGDAGQGPACPAQIAGRHEAQRHPIVRHRSLQGVSSG